MADTQTASNRRLVLAYAESSRDLVTPLARALEAAGFDVQAAPAGQAQADEAIDSAGAVIACWTPAAIASDTVNLQAARARKARKLAPVLLAPCTPPANLGTGLGVADLTGWRGDPSEKEFLDLVHSIHARLSGRVLSGEFWKTRAFTWGGAGAVALAAIAVIGNFGDFRQAIDDVVNPAASQKALSATDAKVDQVLALLKAKAERPIDAGSETVMRESIARLLAAQEGARGSAAEKLDRGDIDGAIGELQAATEESVASLVEALKELGALAFPEHTTEALLAYERVAQLAPEDLDSRIQLGQLRMRLGHFAEAEKAFLFVAENAPDDDWLNSAALAGLGSVALQHDDLARAEKYFAETLRINESLDDVLSQSAGHVGLGIVQQTKGEYRAAEQSFQRALDIQLRFGDPDGQAAVHRNLGILSLERGELDNAERLLNKALAMSDDMEGQTTAIGGLAEVANQRGDTARAQELSEKGLALAERINAHRQQALFLVALGQLAATRGDRMEAIQRYQTAQEIYRFMEQDDDVREMAGRMRALGATPHPEGPEN